jgi:hypothetical protein
MHFLGLGYEVLDDLAVLAVTIRPHDFEGMIQHEDMFHGGVQVLLEGRSQAVVPSRLGQSSPSSRNSQLDIVEVLELDDEEIIQGI